MPGNFNATSASRGTPMSSHRPDDRKLVLIMVGLPARGKSYTARKLAWYLKWQGYNAQLFNVGEYRRAKHGPHQNHAFFDPNNADGMSARRALALEALQDMTSWLDSGGEVGIYDATNSTRERRAMILERCERSDFQVLFIELRCDDRDVIDANIRATKLMSPDYVDVDPNDAADDFRARIAHYEGTYQPLGEDEGSFISVVDAGRMVTINEVDGYIASRLVFFLMNLHLTPRPIWLTRHGESEFNRKKLLGGDASLSAAGQRYAESLASRVNANFDRDQGITILTSSLQRTIQTAAPIGRRSTAWRALNEIDAGICEAMSYEEIERTMPTDFAARTQDKFRYRYPQGESYQDVIKRLQPVIIEIERAREPVIVVGHQAILRALYAYLVCIPSEQCPHLDIPLHTLIELTPHAYGCDEKRIQLKPGSDDP